MWLAGSSVTGDQESFRCHWRGRNECGLSEETAPEKLCGQVTVATTVLEEAGAGITKPPPGSEIDGSAKERPVQGTCLSPCQDTEDESTAVGSTSPSR